MITNQLPKDKINVFLQKLGLTEEVLMKIEKEAPGNCNYSKRLNLALELWSGLVFNIVPFKTTTFDSTNNVENIDNEIDKENGKNTSLFASTSLHDSVRNLSMDLLPPHFERLLHIIYLMGLEDLHKELTEFVHISQQMSI